MLKITIDLCNANSPDRDVQQIGTIEIANDHEHGMYVMRSACKVKDSEEVRKRQSAVAISYIENMAGIFDGIDAVALLKIMLDHTTISTR